MEEELMIFLKLNEKYINAKNIKIKFKFFIKNF